MDNLPIAHKLSEYATLLDATHSDLYRVRAYLRAADTVRALDEPLRTIFEEKGRKGLSALPGIGAHIAFTIEGLLLTGEFRTWRSRAELCDAAPRG